MSESVRINKFLAHSIGLSRREADSAISSGRVTINGRKAVLGATVSSGDHIALDGRTVSLKSSYTYILLNKPVGYLSSRRSQGGVPTIYDLILPKYNALKPVGRLDKNSSGLLLLTDDGNFAHRMTHPSFHKVKIYEVMLDKPLQPLHQQMISDYGVRLDDGVSKFLVENTNPEDQDRKEIVYQVTMSEGRNRQIRRTFAALGYTVTSLHRTTFGPYNLAGLNPGKFTITSVK
ncbi:rRNA pseudouridine synthase [Candidatus Saccharibacteria bacterium]|nr:rRNA pseudouridine synthase [Candidatus Saccharibacteria bacterium]